MHAVPSINSILSALLVIQSLGAPSPLQMGKILQLKSNVNNNEIQCTASLVKINNTCGLFTSAHCVESIGQLVELNIFDNLEGIKLQKKFNLNSPLPNLAIYNQNFNFIYDALIPSDLNNQIKFYTHVVSINKNSDLAALDIPKDIKIKTCPMLTSHAISATPTRAAVSVLGMLERGPLSYYTGTLPWLRGYLSESHISRYLTSPDENDYLFQIMGITLTPGMSGGLAVANDGKLLGFNTRYKAFLDTIYVTPLEAAENLLNINSDSHPPSSPSHQYINKYPGTYTYSILKKDNNQTNTGGNTHGNGGNNHNFSHNFLERAQEAPEGVLINEDTVLLMVGENQIDGWDDYNLHHKGANKSSWTTRKLNSFPNENIRSEILNRLAGNYISKNISVTNQISSSLGKRSIYKLDASWPDKWRQSHNGKVAFNIQIDSDKKSIAIYRENSEVRPYPDFEQANPLDLNDNGWTYYAVDFNNDSKFLNLKEQGSKSKELICKNEHSLKLLCSNSETYLSFSLSKVGVDGDLTFRWIKDLSKSETYSLEHDVLRKL